MNKNFLKAISDIKKQKQKQHENQKPEAKQKQEEKEERDEKEDSISSSEEKKLKSLGAYKKKIVKNDKQQQKWKHDRYKQVAEQKVQSKPVIHKQSLQIKFKNSPGYNKLLPLVKHIKIYIREIDDTHITFNNSEAYQSALQIYKKAGLEFTAQ